MWLGILIGLLLSILLVDKETEAPNVRICS